MLRRTLLSITLLVVSLVMTWAAASADEPKYDPRVHVYREGMGTQGAMGSNVRYGTLESLIAPELLKDPDVQASVARAKSTNQRIPLFDLKGGTLVPQVVEYGSWRFPSGEGLSGDAFFTQNVRTNSCGGGDDAWADRYYINEDEFFANRYRVWSTNLVTSTQIKWLGYLDGGYYCVGGSCTLSACTTQAWGSDPWALYFLRRP